MKKTFKRKSNFTIVELLVAMGVFAILMLALMQFFTSAQQVWLKSSNRSEVFENARVALNMMATDLQCAYYEMGHGPKRIFFAVEETTNYKKFALAAIRTSTPSGVGSRLCQAQYIFYNGNAANDENKRYTLQVNEIWDNDLSKWTVTKDQASDIAGIFDFSNTAFQNAADPTSENQLIPYVLDFSFRIFNKADTEITGNTADKFPYKVELTLTVVDKTTFERWKSVSTDLNSNILKAGKRDFTRVVLIERGQYD